MRWLQGGSAAQQNLGIEPTKLAIFPQRWHVFFFFVFFKHDVIMKHFTKFTNGSVA